MFGEMDFYDIGIPDRIRDDHDQGRWRDIMDFLTWGAELLVTKLYNDRRELTPEDKQYIKKMIKSFRWKSTRIFNKLWEYQNREVDAGYEPVV